MKCRVYCFFTSLSLLALHSVVFTLALPDGEVLGVSLAGTKPCRFDGMPCTLINDSLSSRFVPQSLGLRGKYFALFLTTLALGAVILWFSTATQVRDLGAGNNMIKSKLKETWMQGSTVVLVRHAERCDRSANPCLSDAEGITVNGSNAAIAVGTGLRQLGLERARMIASPSTPHPADCRSDFWRGRGNSGLGE